MKIDLNEPIVKEIIIPLTETSDEELSCQYCLEPATKIVTNTINVFDISKDGSQSLIREIESEDINGLIVDDDEYLCNKCYNEYYPE